MDEAKMAELAVKAAKRMAAWEKAVLDVSNKQRLLTCTIDELLVEAGIDNASLTLGDIMESLNVWLEKTSSVPVKAIIERRLEKP